MIQIKSYREGVIQFKNTIGDKEIIKDAQQYMPEFLDEIIQKNLMCIKFFKTPNNQTPLFNGASEKILYYYENVFCI